MNKVVICHLLCNNTWITYTVANVLCICIARETYLRSNLHFLCAFRYALAKQKWLRSRASSTFDWHPFWQAVRSDLIVGELLSWFSGMQFTWIQLISQVITGHSHTWYKDSAWLKVQLPDSEMVWQQSRMFPCACACSFCLLFLIFDGDCTVGIPLFVSNRWRIFPPHFYFHSAESECSWYLAPVWIIDHFVHKKYRM